MRFSAWRAAFFADLIIGINVSSRLNDKIDNSLVDYTRFGVKSKERNRGVLLIFDIIEDFGDERSEKEIEKVADDATDNVGDDVGDVGGTAVSEEELKELDGETEEESVEDGFEEAGIFGSGEGE